MNPAQQLLSTLQEHTAGVVFGNDDTLHSLCVALIARGHILLEGPPGLGKTLIAKTLARQLGGSFGRIQCTADLMPSDMTGTHIFRPGDTDFQLMPGPLFADVVLVDELNRTGPKTQSALLEAMAEQRVTIDRNSYELPENFLVIATQNPHDFEGTYPLPESQLDRFLMRLQLDYPDAAVEEQVLRAYDRPGASGEARLQALPELPAGLLGEARQQAADVVISDVLYGYVTAIAAASRNHPQVSLGLSTRGALALMRCARIEAALAGSDFVTPDHVKRLTASVIAHRLILTPEAALEDTDAASVLESILAQVPVPRDQAQ